MRSVLEILAEKLEAGLVVGGAYRLEHPVGEGGMGVVWAAREIASGRAVAVKFLREGHEDPKTRARFMREARASMAIAHPHVAKVETVRETETGVPFLVMELLEGESMRTLLTRRGALSSMEAARLLRPVVSAVAAAHAQRIVHRDLKPENVFLVKGEHVRVLDFGIAKQLRKDDLDGKTASMSLTSTGAMIGTPAYMAPEQIFGEEIDGRADVWALGIILYECISGVRPTEADGIGPMIKRITVDPIAPLDRVRPGVPRSLAQISSRMLARDRRIRPSLAEIDQVLAQVAAAPDAGASTLDAPPRTLRMPQTGPSAFAPTESAPAPARSEERSQRGLVAGLVAGMSVLVLGAVAGGAYGIKRLTTPKPPSIVVPAISFSVPSLSGSGVPTATAGTDAWRDAIKAIDEARDAHKQRDGAACVRWLDKHDALIAPDGDVTTNHTSSWADLRAECLMLAGRCNEGRALLRRRLERSRAGSPLETEIEEVVADYCEGTELSPREALLRAQRHLVDVAYGVGTPAVPAAQCEAWHADIRRLVTSVPSKGKGDNAINDVRADDGDRLATICYARANQCDRAFKLFRDRQKKNGIDEEFTKRLYADTIEKTPCSKPK